MCYEFNGTDYKSGLKLEIDGSGEKGKNTKNEVEQTIQRLIEKNPKIRTVLRSNYAAASRMILIESTTGYLPSERSIAEDYLPRMYPK